jgi:hypothetical protein
VIALALLAPPLSAQAWDLRLEAPFAQATMAGSGSLDTGHGAIFTLSHRIVRVGPVLKFEWNAEFAQLRADGQTQPGAGSRLKQDGAGAGINAQFWMPFTGFAGELGLLERVHSCSYEGAGFSRSETIASPWLRAGLRWVLPFLGTSPYLAASYQKPLTRDQALQPGSVQQFQHLWTLGVGLAF